MHTTSYELIFEAQLPEQAQSNAEAPRSGTMRIQITSNFEAPQELTLARQHLLAMAHMGEDWQRAGLHLLDVRRIDECPVSVL